MDQVPTNRLFRSERATFFSDGVFAIALTLLVIELRLPEAEGGASLMAALGTLWPRFLSFVISFLVVSVVWFNHHLMFDQVERVDHRVIVVNLVLLFNIIGMPFVAEVLGTHLVASDPVDVTLSALVYGGWITWGGVAFNLVWWAVLHVPVDQPNQGHRRALGFHFVRGPLLYGLATLAAFLSVWVSIVAFTLLILLFFLPVKIRRPRRPLP